MTFFSSNVSNVNCCATVVLVSTHANFASLASWEHSYCEVIPVYGVMLPNTVLLSISILMIAFCSTDALKAFVN